MPAAAPLQDKRPAGPCRPHGRDSGSALGTVRLGTATRLACVSPGTARSLPTRSQGRGSRAGRVIPAGTDPGPVPAGEGGAAGGGGISPPLPSLRPPRPPAGPRRCPLPPGISPAPPRRAAAQWRWGCCAGCGRAGGAAEPRTPPGRGRAHSAGSRGQGRAAPGLGATAAGMRRPGGSGGR